MTQEQRLYEYLKENSGITTLTAMNDLGISRLSNVIHDLKSQGIQIVSSYTKSYNRYGEEVMYKVYQLRSDGDES